MARALTALHITPESYRLYTEIMEDSKRVPLELEDVNTNFMLVDDSVPQPPKIWFISPFVFREKYDILAPETETEFAVVTPK